MTKDTKESAGMAESVLRLRAKYANRPNVTGFDYGYKWRDGEVTEDRVLRIHVKEKIPESKLEAAELLPTKFEGYEIDIIAGQYRVPQSYVNSTEEHYSSTLMGGISCGRTNGGAGTLGALVIDNRTGKPAILSNWHVMTGATGRRGDPILQPGVLDGGHPDRDVVANLGRSLLAPQGDAAIAFLNGRRPWLPTQFEDMTVLPDIEVVRLGEELRKVGRSTNSTEAKVDGIGSYGVNYEVSPGVSEVRWINGFKLVPKRPGNPGNEEISAAGDSGSIWFNRRKEAAIGLHFAGETNPLPGNEHAIACHIKDVSEALDFRMATLADVVQALSEFADNGMLQSELRAGVKYWPASGEGLPGAPTSPSGPTRTNGPISGPTPCWPPRGPRPPVWPPIGPFPTPIPPVGPTPSPWFESRPESAIESTASPTDQSTFVGFFLRRLIARLNSFYPNLGIQLSGDTEVSKLSTNRTGNHMVAHALNTDPEVQALGIRIHPDRIYERDTLRDVVIKLHNICLGSF